MKKAKYDSMVKNNWKIHNGSGKLKKTSPESDIQTIENIEKK